MNRYLELREVLVDVLAQHRRQREQQRQWYEETASAVLGCRVRVLFGVPMSTITGEAALGWSYWDEVSRVIEIALDLEPATERRIFAHEISHHMLGHIRRSTAEALAGRRSALAKLHTLPGAIEEFQKERDRREREADALAEHIYQILWGN